MSCEISFFKVTKVTIFFFFLSPPLFPSSEVKKWSWFIRVHNSTFKHPWLLKGTHLGALGPAVHGSAFTASDNARIIELKPKHQPSSLIKGHFSACSNGITHQNLLREKRVWAG